MTAEAETRQHTHLGSYALIVRHDDVLLVLKARGPYTGRWDLPGGRIEFGESPEAALARELREETGFQMTGHPQLITTGSHTVLWHTPGGIQETLHHLGFIYRVAVDEELQAPEVLEENEDASAADWKARGDLADLPLTPFARLATKAWL